MTRRYGWWQSISLLGVILLHRKTHVSRLTPVRLIYNYS